MTSNEENYIPHLLMIDRVHEARYGTIKLLKGLFDNVEIILSNHPRDTQFTARLYTQRLIIELTCQYVEDVARYSLACLETGLLYAKRVISATPKEIGDFWTKADALKEEDVVRIFNIQMDDGVASEFDFLGTIAKYKGMKTFRDKYQSLYNAIKHGNRVLHMELSTEDRPMDSLTGTYVSYQWVEVQQRLKEKVKVMARDGSEMEIEIPRLKNKEELIQSDNINEFLSVAENCHQIIFTILQNHSPRLSDKQE